MDSLEHGFVVFAPLVEVKEDAPSLGEHSGPFLSHDRLQTLCQLYNKEVIDFLNQPLGHSSSIDLSANALHRTDKSVLVVIVVAGGLGSLRSCYLQELNLSVIALDVILRHKEGKAFDELLFRVKVLSVDKRHDCIERRGEVGVLELGFGDQTT